MARRSDSVILELNDVACRRGGRELFAHFTTRLKAGESLQVAGPNGVGKSSLIRLIAGLLPCYEGNVGRTDSVALTDERGAMDGGSTLRQMLDFWKKLDEAEPTSLDAAAAHFGLSPLMDVPTRMLSTGQRKRAALVRCLASGARLWLLDEPGNGLDAGALAALGNAMDAHVASGGAIVAASHFDLPHEFSQTITLGKAK
jgi:heme exporter protein A